MDKTGNIINLLELGARAEGLRQRTIATNIANMETPKYRRQDIQFEELLNEALSSDKPLQEKDLNEMIYTPENSPVKENGNDVSLEHEVGQMIKNSIRHKTFMRVLSKKYQQMALAMDTRG
jgi:flagellar basal-body rod protein FlgB